MGLTAQIQKILNFRMIINICPQRYKEKHVFQIPLLSALADVDIEEAIKAAPVMSNGSIFT